MWNIEKPFRRWVWEVRTLIYIYIIYLIHIYIYIYIYKGLKPGWGVTTLNCFYVAMFSQAQVSLLQVAVARSSSRYVRLPACVCRVLDVSGPCLQPRLLLIGSISNDWALKVPRNEFWCIKHSVFSAAAFVGMQICIVFWLVQGTKHRQGTCSSPFHARCNLSFCTIK